MLFEEPLLCRTHSSFLAGADYPSLRRLVQLVRKVVHCIVLLKTEHSLWKASLPPSCYNRLLRMLLEAVLGRTECVSRQHPRQLCRGLWHKSDAVNDATLCHGHAYWGILQPKNADHHLHSYHRHAVCSQVPLQCRIPNRSIVSRCGWEWILQGIPHFTRWCWQLGVLSRKAARRSHFFVQLWQHRECGQRASEIPDWREDLCWRI